MMRWMDRSLGGDGPRERRSRTLNLACGCAVSGGHGRTEEGNGIGRRLGCLHGVATLFAPPLFPLLETTL